jgi:hypothetical protein
MKLFTSLICTFFVLIAIQAVNAQNLKVSENDRYLIKEDGNPFFYMGDTAWELFHRLTKKEADRYLKDRADKGFTVIQAVVLSQVGGLDVPNAEGYIPLNDNDPSKPNENYFKLVDYILDKAGSLGLVIGMLPTWGSYWSSLNPENVIFNPDNAYTFGKFLGKRYPNGNVHSTYSFYQMGSGTGP